MRGQISVGSVSYELLQVHKNSPDELLGCVQLLVYLFLLSCLLHFTVFFSSTVTVGFISAVSCTFENFLRDECHWSFAKSCLETRCKNPNPCRRGALWFCAWLSSSLFSSAFDLLSNSSSLCRTIGQRIDFIQFSMRDLMILQAVLERVHIN